MAFDAASLTDPTMFVDGTASVSSAPDSVRTMVMTESDVLDAEETVNPVTVKSLPATDPEEISSLNVARMRSICPSTSLSAVEPERKMAEAASESVAADMFVTALFVLSSKEFAVPFAAV